MLGNLDPLTLEEEQQQAYEAGLRQAQLQRAYEAGLNANQSAAPNQDT